MRGSTFKRCGCRDPNTGRKLGTKCPELGKKGHGAWWARFEAPRSADGRRNQPLIGPYATEREAEDALVQMLGRVNQGTYVDAGRQTFGDYLDQWLAGKAKLKPGTRHSYATHVRLYLKPGLGHVRLGDLRDGHFEDLYAAMRQIGRPAKAARPFPMLLRLLEARSNEPQARRPLSAARVRRVHSTVMSALNSAVKRRRIAHNPAAHVELEPGRAPKPLVWTRERVEDWQRTGRRPSPVMVWTARQTGAFLDFAAEDRLYPLWHVIAYRGLRRGEAVRLAWSDVDLDAGVVMIREAKSEAGERVLSLDKATIAVLHGHREAQERDRRLWGPAWVDCGLVFTKENGEALNPDSVSQRFDRLLILYERTRREYATQNQQTGKAPGVRELASRHRLPERAVRVTLESGPLPPIRLHDLRHGAATLALAAGVDIKVVSEQLGHASSQFTRDVYTSVLPEVAHAAAEAVANLIPRSGLPSDSAGSGAVCTVKFRYPGDRSVPVPG